MDSNNGNLLSAVLYNEPDNTLHSFHLAIFSDRNKVFRIHLKYYQIYNIYQKRGNGNVILVNFQNNRALSIRIRSGFSKHLTIKNCDKLFRSILRKLKVC